MALLDGPKRVINALFRRREQYGRNFERTSLEVVRYILNQCAKIIPIKTARMANTGFGRVRGSGFQAIAEVGYGTHYALYVHEDLDKVHGEAFNVKYAAQIAAGTETARRPQEQAKFLSDPIARARRDGSLARIVQRGMQPTNAGFVQRATNAITSWAAEIPTEPGFNIDFPDTNPAMEYPVEIGGR
jgi:hypothetical protein